MIFNWKFNNYVARKYKYIAKQISCQGGVSCFATIIIGMFMRPKLP